MQNSFIEHLFQWFSDNPLFTFLIALAILAVFEDFFKGLFGITTTKQLKKENQKLINEVAKLTKENDQLKAR